MAHHHLKLLVLLSLLISTLLTLTTAGTTVPVVDEARAKTEEEGSESLTDWAKQKISKGLGLKKTDNEDLEKKAGDKESTQELASETAKEGKRKAEETAGMMKDDSMEQAAASAKEKVKEGYGTTMEKTAGAEEAAKRAVEEASRKAREAEERATEKAKEKAKDGYETAKTTLDSAKEKIASNYEAAKERLVGGGAHNREDEL